MRAGFPSFPRQTLAPQAAVVLALAFLASCDKMPLMAPTGTEITLYASSTVMPVNGSVEITATVIESAGTPVQNGTVVTFLTTLGTLDPVEARTNAGKATVRLYSGSQSGIAEVRAASGGASIVDALQIKVGGAAAERVDLFASPSSLPPSGGAVQLVATVSDANGNRLAGVPVTFIADEGALSQPTVISDGQGEARNGLTTTVAATVMAIVRSDVSADVTVNLRSAPAVAISSDTSAPTENQPVTFTVTITTEAGSAAVRTASVDFGDGSSQTIGTGTTTTQHTYTRAGTFTVVATATDAAGETSVATFGIFVQPAPAINITVSYTPSSPVKDQIVTFTATTSCASGTCPIDRYEWDFGDGASAITTGPSSSRAYGAAGIYNVVVRVFSTNGQSGVARFQIGIGP
ncbi:MAG: PKD domain-containing protein [Acidobacteriota bacterium]